MSESYIRRTEPDFTAPKAPAQTKYDCDVLVVGGGFAGLMAAVSAKTAGNRVVLVDKGLPGYSGLSPFVSDTRWFDPNMGDDQKLLEEYNVRASQYMGNLNWFRVWCEESKGVFEKYREFGICEQYPSAKEAGFSDRGDYVGYCQYVGARDRHPRFLKTLREHGVTVVPHTMICEVLVENGAAVGVVGFDVPSGAVITCRAKAVVLCMGGGVYKSAGWPTGGISFDAVAIGYRLGLPIIGQEFEDFHKTRADAPSNAARSQGYIYLQSIMYYGGEVTTKDVAAAAADRGNLSAINAIMAANGAPRWEKQSPDFIRPMLIRDPHPGEIRCTKQQSGPDMPVKIQGNCAGAAPGFCMHTASGIYCGSEDTHGATGIPGLYCAGDGCNAGPVGGCAYAGRMGFTSNFFGVQGKRAGEAAREYAKTAASAAVSEETLQAAADALLQPMHTEKGYDPNWALDCLQGIMAPMWTTILKNKPCLDAALTQVCFLRDHVVPKLLATDGHSLRSCIELKNKVLEAEMKLRLSLAREESRGGHYRTDFPYRDDANFLCYLAARRGADGAMQIERIEYPDEWKGDLSQPYEVRYGGGLRFPGETEAIQAKDWAETEAK